ncbi:hypothetical protein G6O67_003746 [Ophiocordyceps sinensis]|uniref:Uncharacterized protein n=1 Tax=Ophiocordyceps sinensis TaxID=72228 RepID=A0A8H4PSF5_9HYPO|nr:hypothetical protein G6O67_003746 [Ophiocordyceps sinensis]
MQNFQRTRHFTYPRADDAYSASSWPRAAPTPIRDNGVYLSSSPKHHLRRRPFPPPASVEDEAESLAREHGTSTLQSTSDEETPSRGEIDQHPVIMEVHEYNPERRFVMLNDPPPASIDDAQTKQTTTRPQKNNGTDNAESR